MPVRIAGSAADYHVFRNRLLKEIPAAGAGASMVARHVDGTFQRKPGLHHLGFAFHLRVPCNQKAHIPGCQADSDRVVVGVLIAFILGSQNREGGDVYKRQVRQKTIVLRFFLLYLPKRKVQEEIIK